MVDVGFCKAQSDNLPRVDAMMVASFMQSNPCFTSAEIKGVKTTSASREQYGDAAVGYVQVKRDQSKCTVKCKICPEHKVREKQYAVAMIVDEAEEVIVSVECNDCAAALGGCKHAIAFLMWVHRRSEEPACTSIESYWKKSILSKVGTTLKYTSTKEFGHKKPYARSVGPSKFFCKVIETAAQINTNSQLLKHTEGYKVQGPLTLSLHQLMFKFVGNGGQDCDDFFLFLKGTTTEDMCTEVARLTESQYKSALWHELRYGRITASKAHDVVRCKTADGTLVENIMGAYKVPDTAAMKRGRLLEQRVLVELKRRFNYKFEHCGLLISKEHPFIGASPDAVSVGFVVEIKCPVSTKTFKNYIVDQDTISSKCLAQVQLQMHISNKKKCLFCVADPQFEINNNFTIVWVDYDKHFVDDLIKGLQIFWQQNIFPKIFASVNH